ncbi:MAG: MBL fold metallo-hydrolase [Candidatus Micrarchaeota archaeon]|nr:MBL fold metallo-hydrolase [Candidatus Micrarchaeota archaeon]
MKLTFNGAAGIVTGSCYLLEAAGEKILIDCGMFQGTKEITRLNYEPFRFNPKEISYLLLTHTHIDHSGLIPKLVKNGFRGKIIATPPTIDLTKIMLKDSAHVNEDDTIHENARRMRLGLKPRDPLYLLADVLKSFEFFHQVKYKNPYKLTNNLTVTFHDAGHILGSSIIELLVRDAGKTTKIIFSGDLGQGGTQILDDPAIIQEADFVLVESTYGNRPREDSAIRGDLLSKEVNEAFARGGKLLIPSFAVERTQELLYYLHRLIRDGKFPAEMVFLDSPLAIEVTEVFKKYMNYFSPSLRKEFTNPFNFNQLKCLKTADESRSMNDYNKPCIIIAGSGMCNAGRIRHHLKHNIWKSQNTLLFVGYQAEGTLGRVILEGAKTVKMMGLEVAVKAKIRKIESFSSHADSTHLISWITALRNKPKKIFIVHGELESSRGLQTALNKLGFTTHVPYLGESVELK